MSDPIINYPVYACDSTADYWMVRDSYDFLIARCTCKQHALAVAKALNALNAQERAAAPAVDFTSRCAECLRRPCACKPAPWEWTPAREALIREIEDADAASIDGDKASRWATSELRRALARIADLEGPAGDRLTPEEEARIQRYCDLEEDNRTLREQLGARPVLVDVIRKLKAERADLQKRCETQERMLAGCTELDAKIADMNRALDMARQATEAAVRRLEGERRLADILEGPGGVDTLAELLGLIERKAAQQAVPCPECAEQDVAR